MSVQIILEKLIYDEFCVNAMSFIPDLENLKPQWAIFTHGYTSHKGDLINWAQRLSEAGIPTIIFDLPGHYLGSYNEVSSFEKFINFGPLLFPVALEALSQKIRSTFGVKVPQHLILGGHSLGALFSLLATDLKPLETYNKICIGVGIGMSSAGNRHLFETAFYRNTLNIRRQLVSTCIGPELVFPWVRDQKNALKITGKRIHLIVGEDDLVVGQNGMEILKELLEKNGNEVTSHKPRSLAHHQPGLGSAFIFSFLKDYFKW